jgi:hypothetical protein
VVLLLSLACGSADGPTVAATPPYQAPLVAPWDGWSLPVGDGRVVASNAGLLTVRYAEPRGAELTGAWRTAFTAAGFVETLDHQEGGLSAFRFTYGATTQTLELSVIPRPEGTVVSAVLVPDWPAGDAGTVQARK